MNDTTSIIIPCKNVEHEITKCYELLNKLMKKHCGIEKLIFTDINSTDLTITILSLLIERDHNTKTIIIRHKKKITIGEAINNATKTTTSNNIIILEPQLYTRLRQIGKQIFLLRKCQIVIPKKADKRVLNLAYKKELITFSKGNDIRTQLEELSRIKNYRITKPESHVKI